MHTQQGSGKLLLLIIIGLALFLFLYKDSEGVSSAQKIQLYFSGMKGKAQEGLDTSKTLMENRDAQIQAEVDAIQ